jgi:(2Fe-2S) ferredoxin
MPLFSYNDRIIGSFYKPVASPVVSPIVSEIIQQQQTRIEETYSESTILDRTQRNLC